MKFRILGAEYDTNTKVDFTVDADSADHASRIAKDRRVMVFDIISMDERQKYQKSNRQQHSSLSVRQAQIIVGVAFLISCVAVALIMATAPEGFGGTTARESQIGRDDSTALLMMQEFILDDLKSPSSADFPSRLMHDAGDIAYLGGGKYRISSWFEAKNSFGTKIRTHYVGTIQEGKDDRWTLIDFKYLDR